jgi:hypothetical protein
VEVLAVRMPSGEAGFGELLDLAEADVDAELFALDGDGLGVCGTEAEGASYGFFGEEVEVGGKIIQ